MEEKDHGAGLIHQTIPDVVDTAPRPNSYECGAVVTVYPHSICHRIKGHSGNCSMLADQ